MDAVLQPKDHETLEGIESRHLHGLKTLSFKVSFWLRE
jgi:hypothetical protein